MDAEPMLSSRAHVTSPDPLAHLYAELAEKPDVVSFAVGAPQTDTLPVDLVESATRVAFARHGATILQYGETQGFRPFLKAVEGTLGSRGVTCSENQTFVSTGGSGALNNIAMALLEPGRTVLVERPTYPPAMAVFRGYGAQVVEVDTDQSGLRPEALADALTRHSGAVLYVLPTFQNPTGRTMPAERRAEIAEVLGRFGTLAIEDDVYADLRFRGQPVLSLHSFAPNNVIYLTSMSKTVAPALRLGIATMPSALLLDAALRLKPGIDMQTSTFAQAICAELLSSSQFPDHVARIVDTYGKKLRLLIASCERHLPSGYHWTSPDGGMFAWLTGPDDFDSGALLPAAIAAGVAYVPGNVFYADDTTHRNTLRLSTGSAAAHDIDRGIKRLGAVLRGSSHG